MVLEEPDLALRAAGEPASPKKRGRGLSGLGDLKKKEVAASQAGR